MSISLLPSAVCGSEAPFLPAVCLVEPCLDLEALSRVLLLLLTTQSLAGLRGSRCSSFGSCAPLLVQGSRLPAREQGTWYLRSVSV